MARGRTGRDDPPGRPGVHLHPLGSRGQAVWGRLTGRIRSEARDLERDIKGEIEAPRPGGGRR